MSINGMNGQFGMNIKKYQQQGVRFGAALTGGSKLGAGFQLNDSIFKPNDKNLFMRSKQMRMETRGGYNADAIRMLNEKAAKEKAEAEAKAKGDQNAQKQPSLKDVGKDMKSAIKAFDDAFGKGGKKADAAKSAGNTKTSEAVKDIKNAQDKETLQGAVDGAKSEQSGVQAQQRQADSQAKVTAQNETNASQTAQQTEQRQNQATQTLNQNEQKLSEAKSEVQTCESNYSAAQTKTSDCRQALANAKAAATEDNPNTAAIAQAEANLKSAEAEEQQAKQQLEAAKQKETQAQQAVEQSKQDVQQATAENNKAQSAANQAKTENQQAQSEVSQAKQQTADLQTGIAEGEQRLQQMNNPVETDGTSETNNTEPLSQVPNSDAAPIAEDNQSKSMSEIHRDRINNGDYSTDEKQKMNEAMNTIMDMKPGQSVEIDGMTYKMDDNGNIEQYDNSSGRQVGSYSGASAKETAAVGASEYRMRKIDTRKQDDAEFDLYQNEQIKRKKPNEKAS